MIDHICDVLTADHINPAIPAGVFVSCVGSEGQVAWSHGVLASEQPVRVQIEALLAGQQVNQGQQIVVDIVEKSRELTDAASILATSPVKYGFALLTMSGELIGALLPGVSGVTTAKDAITAIKQKHNLSSQNVRIFVYTTSRHYITDVSTP